MTETTDLAAWERIAGYYFGTLMLGCYIDPRRCVANVFLRASATFAKPLKSSIRQRGSIASHVPMSRNRAESQATSRLRSNSNLTSNSTDAEDLIEHPVESRTRTAELPPVMVSIKRCRITVLRLTQ